MCKNEHMYAERQRATLRKEDIPLKETNFCLYNLPGSNKQQMHGV